MTSRERVRAALALEPVDKAPLEYHRCGRGLYEHGEALRSLIKAHPGDFEDFSDEPVPQLPADARDPDGSYHEFKTDEWGVTWESRIFAMMGHPCRQPLADWAALDGFRCPPHALADGKAFDAFARHVAQVKKTRYEKCGWFGFFERMHALRPFEDVLMDVYDNGREINRLADMLVEYVMEELRLTCAAGVDAVQFGDDFGTSRAMLLSPEVWPQLTAYDMPALAAKLRELHLACAIHIDRANVMTHGTPEDVTRAVHAAAKAFDIMNGGAYFYVETDNGFPLENIRALLDAIGTYRKDQ